MQRPDLPPGYDGWQVCDATPQELSQGTVLSNAGPAVVVLNVCVFVLRQVPMWTNVARRIATSQSTV